MKIEIYNQAKTIWSKAASKSFASEVSFEVELYKKLLNVFQVGDYYYMIFNWKTVNAGFVSNEMEHMMGYSTAEYDIPFVMSKIHPDDRSYVLKYENSAMAFLIALPVDKLLKYKIRYDLRIQKSNGEYIRILQQGLVLEHDEQGGIVKTLLIHTDITHLKQDGAPVLSFIGLEGEPSYINVQDEKQINAVKDVLTPREKQVLSLIIDGKPSKEIAGLLNISVQTVDTHRKNMLSKNKLNNTGELVAKAIKQGWL